jgi:hypothetical protein
MAAGKNRGDYNPELTDDCKRVLALLLSAVGEWRKSIVLIGGLTPEFMGLANPKGAGAYVGTGDVDLAVDLAIAADPEAYSTFVEALEGQGFKPLAAEGRPAWQWEYRFGPYKAIVIEFLIDDPNLPSSRIKPLPEHGKLAGCNIPHSSIVFDLHETTTITIDLPDGRGVTKQSVLYADIVAFIALKIFAFRNRHEGKDVHDPIHCIEAGDITEIAGRFVAALKGKHGEVIQRALDDLHTTFADEEGIEGYTKDGPAMAARFEIEGDDAEIRERRILRQREFATIVNSLLAEIAKQRKAAGV